MNAQACAETGGQHHHPTVLVIGRSGMIRTVSG